MRKFSLFLTIIFVIIGYSLRWIGLSGSEFFRDEAFSGLVAQRSVSEITKLVALDSNAPLMYLIHHFVGTWFGFTTFVMRFPSFIFSLIAIFYFQKLLTNLQFKPTTKHFLVALFSINPVMIYYGYEARFYGFFIMIFILQLYEISRIKLAKRITLIDQFKFVLLSIFGLYNHNLYLIVLAVMGLTCLIYPLTSKDGMGSNPKKTILKILITFGIIIAGYLPWLPVLWGQFQKGGSGGWLRFDYFNTLFQTLGAFMVWPAWFVFRSINLNSIICVSLALVALILVVIGFISLSKKRNTGDEIFTLLAIILLSTIVIFFQLSQKIPIFFIRYLAFLIPLYFVFLGIAVETFNTKLRTFVICLILLFSSYISIRLTYPSVENNINVTSAINDIVRMKKDKFIVINNDSLTFFNMEFYGKGNFESYIFGKESSTPYWMGSAVIPKNRFLSSLPLPGTIESVFVIRDREISDSLLQELKDKNFFKKLEINYKSNLKLELFSVRIGL